MNKKYTMFIDKVVTWLNKNGSICVGLGVAGIGLLVCIGSICVRLGCSQEVVNNIKQITLCLTHVFGIVFVGGVVFLTCYLFLPVNKDNCAQDEIKCMHKGDHKSKGMSVEMVFSFGERFFIAAFLLVVILPTFFVGTVWLFIHFWIPILIGICVLALLFSILLHKSTK